MLMRIVMKRKDDVFMNLSLSMFFNTIIIINVVKKILREIAIS